MEATLKVYQNKYLWNYIESFNKCPECNKEFELSWTLADSSRNCVIRAWEALGYYRWN